ncbi:SRPBCC domain-containing protein [Fontimonas sp. SYSU GA230001]|uniref:SRPBCC domain-containing protein n=1 Tax=Fontimonas sp. SYSU GA230001 TaxID=3142450 RepID=UPI0032B34299
MIPVRYVSIVTALLLSLAGPSGHAKVIDSSVSGFTIENSYVVEVDVDSAWKALVNDVDRWWPRDHTWFGSESTLSIEPRAGGCFCEIAGARQVQHMTVAFADPGRLLRMVGGLGPMQGMGLHGALDWSFEKVEGGTRLSLRYTVGGYSPTDLREFAPVVDQVQNLQLGGLAKWLEPAR